MPATIGPIKPPITHVVAVECLCCKELIKVTGAYLIIEGLKLKNKLDDKAHNADWASKKIDLENQTFCNVDCLSRHISLTIDPKSR